MTFGYGDRWWENKPADLEKTDAASAAKAASTSKDSYTKTIKMSLVRGKEYKFWFKYKYEDPETKEVTLSDSSPIWKETFAIPNLTKAVLNLTLTAGYKSYGVKFDLDPLSFHEDIVIYESLTSTNIGNEVYRGTSTNVTIPTNSIATRWITVRTRDKWDDLNKTDTGPLPVTPLNPDPDTTYTVDNPATASADASIDPKDLSGFSLVSTITWSQSTNVKTAGYAIRWSTNNPDTVGVTPLWEYASVSGRDTLSFTATGLIPNTTYYYQVAGVTPYDLVDWTGVTTRTFIASDADGTAAGALARLKSFIAIGGASQDLFKIGTGITQSINLNTGPLVTPPLTAGTYHGIILNKSTTNVGNNFWLTTGQFRVGNPTEFMYWNGTNLYLTGNINATGGKFTGNVQLAIPAGGTTSGTLYAGANPDTGQRIRLNSSGIFAYSSSSTGSNFQTFSLDTAGYMNAKSGLIGGWNLGETTLSNNGVVLDSSLGQISVGSAPSNSVYLSSTGSYRMWAGSQSPTDAAAKFKIGSDGTLYATGAVLGLGAGSTIPGYVQGNAIDFTLSSVTTGINQRLGVVEGDYVKTLTLNNTVNNGLATKNTVFVTTDSTQPYANRAGDLWVNGGDDNTIYTATGVGQNWSSKPNTRFALQTSLSSKLNATAYIVQNAQTNKISADATGFEVYAGSTSTASSGVKITSEGILGYKNGSPTFTLTSSGDATFAGEVRAASGWFGTSYSAGWAIDSNKLLGNSPDGGTQLILNASNGTISGGKINAALLTGNTISGGTIIGTKIQTSSSSTRVQLVDSTIDSMQVLISGTVVGNIFGTTASGGALILQGGSTAPNQFGNVYGQVYVGESIAKIGGSAGTSVLCNGISGETLISGTNGILTGTGQNFNMRSGDTTTSNANAFINSTSGLMARSTSSLRYKTDIETVSYPDEAIRALRPVKYRGIKDMERGDNTFYTGLIAEEVAEIPGLELLVNYNEDGSPEAINYAGFSVVLADVVRRILDRLDALEA